ncbi:MAG: hypothetical protein M3150_08770, partial [Pseudomonadota bacterium]|nr:hypothetical protein [Pseudomonadota bacterium]
PHPAGRLRVPYSMLLAADAVGALAAARVLESRSGLLATNAQTAFVMAMLWCISPGAFAVTTSCPLALALLHASLIGSALALLLGLVLLGSWLRRRAAPSPG